jgi:protocatechuate 3,4-dioxygenase beta subunit
VNEKNGVFGSATAAALSPPRSADGRFEFTGLLPGNYSLVARNSSTRPDPNGFPPPPNLHGHTDIIVTDEDLDNVEVRLVPGVDVTATLRAEEGAEQFLQQVRGLTLSEYQIPGFSNRVVQRDPDGVFRGKEIGPATFSVNVGPLARGVYIKAVRFGGQDITRQPLVLTGSGALEFLLSAKAADVSGTLRDPDGNTVQGAYVLLWPAIPERSNIDGGARNARSDATGNFRIDNLAPGDYYLAAWDQADEGRLGNPDFRALFVSDALKVKLEESTHLTADPKLISVERMTTQFAKLP